MHIELRKWADVGVVAPLDANTLAKVGPIMNDLSKTNAYHAYQIP